MQPTSLSELKPKKVLGIGAHPDDMDVCAGGAFATWAAAGAATHFLVLTDGSKGSEDRKLPPEQLKKTRQGEQKAAAKILGVKDVTFLNYEDGALVCDMDVKKEIVKVIREFKPDVIVTFDPSVLYVAETGIINHPDHRAAGQAALDAIFPLARDHLSFPELLEKGHEPHKTTTVLLINFKEHNFFVDITDTIEKKMKAIEAHKSQFKEIKEFQKSLRESAAEKGRLSGVAFAETFVRVDIG